MSSTLGLYFDPWHWRGEDENYMRRLNPAWVLIHQPTAKAIHVVTQNAPKAKIMLRSWDIDDSNGERKREMYADPKGAARKHLDMWTGLCDRLTAELERNGWAYDDDQWYWQLVNEPDPAFVSQVVEYSLEAMRLSEHLGVVVSSVGTFSKPSENGNGWTLCKPLEKPINDGDNILIAHEYWLPDGPNAGEDGGNLAWRHRIIPLNVPILIGEAGVNGFIYQKYSQTDDAGWGKFMDADKYAAQVREYIAGCDTRVQGVLLYLTDYHSDQWQSFDTFAAHEALLRIADTKPQVASPFASTGPGPTPVTPPAAILWSGTVSAPSGVNVRSGPGPGYAKGRAPLLFGTRVNVRQEVNGWLRIGDNGWVIAKWVQREGTGLPTPTPAPPADKWQRSLAFVLRWEGGFANDPNDSGGATMRGVTIGTYTRWRAAHGQAQPTVEELRAISDAEVATIYFEWYWKKSGADALDWPMCLAVMDLAVNGGVGRAIEALTEAGPNFLKYMAWRIEWYTGLSDWHFFGVAWIRRCADLLREAQ